MAWSQMLYDTEVLMGLNTNSEEERSAEVTVDAYLHPTGSTMKFLYRGDWSDEQLRNPPGDQTVEVNYQPDGRATVTLSLPPAGMAILA